MVLFVLWPLGRAASVSPAVLMRAHLSEERERSAWPYALGSAAAGLALFVLAIAASEERAITASISVGIVLAFLLLTGFGLLVQRYASKFRRAKPPSLGLALASIGGPGSLARSIAVSLGLGLGLLVAVALIHRSLLTEIASNIEVDAPAYYFLDVEAADLDTFKHTVLAIEPAAKLDDAPMLRGRIVALNGVPVEKIEAAPDSRWVLSGDRGLTYTDTVPRDSDDRRGRMVAERLHGAAARLFRRRACQGAGAEARRPHHREHSRPQCRGDHRLLAQDRLGIARHQFRHGVLAQHAARRAAPHAHHARIPERHRPGERKQGAPGAVRSLPARHRHQGRRHRRGGQGAARQG